MSENNQIKEQREEIRWELDKIFEFLDSLINLHRNEQKSFSNNWEKIHSSSIKARNSIIAVIAFGIGIIISLVSIGELDKTYLDFMAYGLILAVIIFIGTYILLYFVGRNYRELDSVYENDIHELLELKGWWLGASIKDKPNKEQIMFLTKFTFVISQVLAYNIKLKIHDLFKENLPDLNEYKEPIQIAKENLDYYKKIDLKIVKTIEKFIEAFEKK